MMLKVLSAAVTAALVAFASACAQNGAAGSSAGGSMSPRSPAGTTTTAGECRGLEGQALENCLQRQGSVGAGSRTSQ